MPTKTLIAGVIFLLFSFSATIGTAQCWRVHYCQGCINNGLCVDRNFNTEEEANTSLRLAVCEAMNIIFGYSSASNVI